MGVKRGFRKTLAVVACAPILAGGSAQALDTFFAGPRAMGMGGANVASVNDTTAQYYNPAAFGFYGCLDPQGKKISCDNNNLGRKDWGLDVGVGIGYRLHNEFGAYLDELSAIDLDALNNGVADQSELADLIDLVNGLDGLDEPGNAITVDATAGVGIRGGHFAVGVRGFMQANGLVLDIDDQNLGFDVSAAQLNTDINSIAMDPSYTSTGYTLQVLTQPQFDQLVAALGGTAQAAESVQRLDFVAAQEGYQAGELDGAVQLLDTAITNAGSGTNFNDNTTTVLMRGFGVVEVPLSYGYALNDHWAIGGNVKLMQGRVYGNQVIVFDDDSDDILAQTDENYKETTTFGVDLGIMGRYRYFNFGIVGRNLNSPKFDGFTFLSGGMPVKVDDVTIDPQVTAGVAFIPFETLTFEVDLDLTENETVFPGYSTQNVYAGFEWDAFRFLALRAGAYKNLSEDDIDMVYTAGLGLNLWAVRADVAGAFSTEKETFDGDEIPSETRAMAQLSVDF